LTKTILSLFFSTSYSSWRWFPYTQLG